MRTIGLILVVFLATAPAAQAGPFGFGGFGHHGIHRGHFGGFGGPGLLGFYDAEFAKSRFEDKFEDLQTNYDEGLAEIDDYYNSDEYSDLVDDTERLSDKYSLFLTGVEFQVNWLDLSITHLTDESSLLDELLAKYEADEDLSEERLERLTDWITRAQDFLTLKIDWLTEKQTTLSENLPTYTAFGEEITTFLDTIIAAGGGESSETEEAETTVTATAIAATALTATTSAAELASSLPAAVPEPGTVALAILALLAAIPRRSVRTRRAA